MVNINVEKLTKMCKKNNVTKANLSLELERAKGYLNNDAIKERGGVRALELEYICKRLNCAPEAILEKDDVQEKQGDVTVDLKNVSTSDLLKEIERRLER